MVVVDEEQRFGVAQKELLRQLRLEVDVLALSATPIPRTLHMSLAGLRDISVIETPPEGRRPIRTYRRRVRRGPDQAGARARDRAQRPGVLPPQPGREHRGGGGEAAALCPNLRFLVAHGQMPERELENQMLKFLAGDADVLVSTTIIESGLDIPQANTLIVERADQLGLSQLYQIRGRVGRSDQLAHAYLFYPEARELTPEARARLATLADHTELGAGFAIAMRDLEIRGAGDLLGAEQSGHVAALGFELYVEMLHEAVAELSGQRRLAARPVRVDARIDAFVPAGYISAEALKIDLHRRIALTETEDELHELKGRDGGPLRPAAGAGREPLRDPGGEAEARAPRRGLPRLPRRQGVGRAGRARLRRAARTALRGRDGGLLDGQPRGDVKTERIHRSARFGRCYAGRAPGGLSRRVPMKTAKFLILDRARRRPRGRLPEAAAAAPAWRATTSLSSATRTSASPTTTR